jgi:hypothetical protein
VQSGSVLVGLPGRTHRLRLAPSGTADLIGLLADGRLLAVEVKSSIGCLRPEQREFIAMVIRHVGVALVARNALDVLQALDGIADVSSPIRYACDGPARSEAVEAACMEGAR